MPNCACTSDKISTRLIESTPNSVSKSISISSISVSYPVFAANTSNTTSTAFAVETPLDPDDCCCTGALYDCCCTGALYCAFVLYETCCCTPPIAFFRRCVLAS